MKYFYIFLFLAFSFTVKANNMECSMMGLQYFPQQNEISLNPMFIIEGYAYSQEHIEALKNREVYLESSSGEKVVLEFQELLKGQMELTQALFRPTESLLPNKRYFLKLSAATNKNDLNSFTERYNRETNRYEPVFWETTGLEYSAAISMDLALEFKGTRVEFFGCGPAANAVFAVLNEGDTEVWYRTEVENLQTRKKTTYYLREYNGHLDVGHDMCAGAFTFSSEGKYKVRFTPLNIDGKESKTTSWTTFNSPYMSAENAYGK